MKAKVVEVSDLNYDRDLIEKTKRQKLGNAISRAKGNISEKVKDVKSFIKGER